MAKFTDRELVDAILSDPHRREAAEQMIFEMMREQARGNVNGRYEVTVVGNAVSTAVYQIRQRTNVNALVREGRHEIHSHG